jgi:endonuclease/exonuclease/phosphatase family metal-dependent hydrolase
MSPVRRFALVFALAACGSANSGAPVGPSDAGTPDAVGPDALAPGPDGSAGTRVRIMAANLTSGTSQGYEQPGIDILEGLVPDVVLIQEFNYAAGDLRTLVDTAFGNEFSFYVEPQTGGIPNGIVSRFPILQSGVWADASVSDRAFVYASIDVPGPIDLWAVSVHLLTTGATERSTEATQLLGYIQSNVPAGDFLVVGGDFNTDTTGEAALTTLSAAVRVAAPFPADQAGNTDSSINRDHPHDWVLSGPSLDARAAPVSLGASSFASGLVFDSRVYTPLSDVPPIVAGDSGATGMQHMAVVRDFLLSSGGT